MSLAEDQKQTTIRFASAAEVELVRKAVRHAARAPIVCYRAWLLIAAGDTQAAADLFGAAEPVNRRDERLARVKDKGGTAINLKMPAEEWTLIQREADRTGLAFATWARLVLLSVAGTDHGAQLVAQLRRLPGRAA